jgi:hypothetical protein
MTVSVMVTGSLFRAAVQKTSKAGKAYVTATIKAVAGGEVEFWTALAFGDTEQAALLNLAEAPRERKPKAEKAERATPANRQSVDPSLNDDIPF